MRTIHADLTTAQRSASRTPYVRLKFQSRDRATVRTYTTNDGTNRILSVQQAEGALGGSLAVPGAKLPISAILHLRDHDTTLSALDFKGYRCDIGWGFNTDSGIRWSEGEAVFVVDQKEISLEGELITELHCVSLWGLALAFWMNTTTAAPIGYDATGVKFSALDFKEIIHELLGGTALAAAGGIGIAIRFNADDSDYLNETSNLEGSDITNEGTLFAATPQVGDIMYFGLESKYNRWSVDLTTVSNNALTIAYEYWNGSAWSALTYTGDDGQSGSVKDDGVGFSSGTLRIIAFNQPTNWTSRDMSGVDVVFPAEALFYTRARITGITTPSVVKAQRVFLGKDFASGLDSSTAGQGDDYKPTYTSDYRQDVLQAIGAFLKRTKLSIVLRKDGFHSLFIDTSGGASIDYIYNSVHKFFSAGQESAPLIPNKIIYTNIEPGASGTRYQGDDTNSASAASIGTITEVRVDAAIASNFEALILAQAEIDQRLRLVNQGELEAPMQVNQEIWDLVQVQDARSGINYTGRVTQLARIYQPGKYSIRLILGGLNRSFLPADLRAASLRVKRALRFGVEEDTVGSPLPIINPTNPIDIVTIPTDFPSLPDAGDKQISGSQILPSTTVAFHRVKAHRYDFLGTGNDDLYMRHADEGSSGVEGIEMNTTYLVFVPSPGAGTVSVTVRASGSAFPAAFVFDSSFNTVIMESKLEMRNDITASATTFDIGDATNYFNQLFINGIVPQAGFPFLGNMFNRFDSGYITEVHTVKLNGDGASIILADNIVPVVSNTDETVGELARFFLAGYFNNLHVLSIHALGGVGSVLMEEHLVAPGGGGVNLGGVVNYFGSLYVNDIVPKGTTPELGTASAFWDTSYINTLNVTTLAPRSGTSIITDTLLPALPGSDTLGDTTSVWLKGWVNTLEVTTLSARVGDFIISDTLEPESSNDTLGTAGGLFWDKLYVNDIVPKGTTPTMGDINTYWNAQYNEHVYSQNFWRRSGAGGNVGGSTNYFNEMHVATGGFIEHSPRKFDRSSQDIIKDIGHDVANNISMPSEVEHSKVVDGHRGVRIGHLAYITADALKDALKEIDVLKLRVSLLEG